jgi:hypothetical protein
LKPTFSHIIWEHNSERLFSLWWFLWWNMDSFTKMAELLFNLKQRLQNLQYCIIKSSGLIDMFTCKRIYH